MDCVDCGGGANIYPAERELEHRDQGALASEICLQSIPVDPDVDRSLVC